MNELVEKVVDWSYSRNIIHGSSCKDQYLKAVSELGEGADAILKNNKEEIKDAIGDVLVCLINVSEQCNLTLEECLSAAYDSIKDRRGIMYNGVFIKDTDPNYQRVLDYITGRQNAEEDFISNT